MRFSHAEPYACMDQHEERAESLQEFIVLTKEDYFANK